MCARVRPCFIASEDWVAVWTGWSLNCGSSEPDGYLRVASLLWGKPACAARRYLWSSCMCCWFPLTYCKHVIRGLLDPSNCTNRRLKDAAAGYKSTVIIMAPGGSDCSSYRAGLARALAVGVRIRARHLWGLFFSPDNKDCLLFDWAWVVNKHQMAYI